MKLLTEIPPLTLDEFHEALEGFDRWPEFKDGRITMNPPANWPHATVAFSLSMILHQIAKSQSGLKVSSDGAPFLIQENPPRLVVPDAALHQWPLSIVAHGYVKSAPIIAVEVVNKTKSLQSAREKAREYLEAGSKQVWLADNEAQAFEIHLPDEPARRFEKGEEIVGERLANGIRFTYVDLL